MIDRFRLPGTLPRRLEELGVSPAAVLRQSHLPASLFSQEKILVTTQELFALYRGISEISRDPGIGLKIGTEERVERYGPIAIAALYARSFRDALQRMARYKQLVCPEKVLLEERGDQFVVRFDWLLAQEEEPALLVDVCFAWVVNVGRRGTGSALGPRLVELRRPTAHREIYEAHFGCAVKFRAKRNALVFGRADIDRPFVTHNSELLAMVAPQLEAELAERLARQTLGEHVKGILKQQLAGQRPELRHVARELRLSTRTLQRRLAEQGVTFQQLLEGARRELARHYLLHSSLELNETAYLLGYEDANSFFRAFHSWEGTSPGEWRAVRSLDLKGRAATTSIHALDG
jgi:AraC-like DNA-binding protein